MSERSLFSIHRLPDSRIHRQNKEPEMKRTILSILILASTISIISCGGGGGGGGTPTGPSGVTASFSATPTSVASNYVKMEQVSATGDTVTIAVKAVSIAQPVGGMAVDVTYDTSKLSYVSSANGDVINGNSSSFIATNNSGIVTISVTDVPDPQPKTDGTLFTIVFKGTTTGSGNVGLTGGSLFSASGGVNSGVTWYGGTVTVQ